MASCLLMAPFRPLQNALQITSKLQRDPGYFPIPPRRMCGSTALPRVTRTYFPSLIEREIGTAIVNGRPKSMQLGMIRPASPGDRRDHEDRAANCPNLRAGCPTRRRRLDDQGSPRSGRISAENCAIRYDSFCRAATGTRAGQWRNNLIKDTQREPAEWIGAR
jgi:hypothetical protein